MRLPRKLSGKESAYQCKRCRRCRFDPWVGKIPWGRKWQPTTVFLPGESHGQRSLEGYSPWGHKESMGSQWATHIRPTVLNFMGNPCSCETAMFKKSSLSSAFGKCITAKKHTSPCDFDKTQVSPHWPLAMPDTHPPYSHSLSHKWWVEQFVPTD